MNWIRLAWDTDQWQALVNMVISLWFPENVGHFFGLGEGLLAFY